MTINNLHILVDNGHGLNTQGKCSPDMSFRESVFTRKVATKLCYRLQLGGVHAIKLVPEDEDISLTERVNRVNSYCNRWRGDNVLLVSVHVNADGMGDKWTEACGFSEFVAPISSRKSKMLAQAFTETAHKMGLAGNRAVPIFKYWVGNFKIIRETKCPAVLTENLFMTNKNDLKKLQSNGVEVITQLHYDAITKYISMQTF